MVATAATGVAAVAFAYLAYVYFTLPDVRSLARVNPRTTAFIELRAAEARAKGQEPRRLQRWVPYGRVSPALKRAVLVAEDAAFWEHDGVDYDELQRSIELDWARGQLVRGASTITQQLAKNLYLSPSRNPVRKLRELIIARRFEAELKKSRILELYLNVIEWGDASTALKPRRASTSSNPPPRLVRRNPRSLPAPSSIRGCSIQAGPPRVSCAASRSS